MGKGCKNTRLPCLPLPMPKVFSLANCLSEAAGPRARRNPSREPDPAQIVPRPAAARVGGLGGRRPPTARAAALSAPPLLCISSRPAPPQSCSLEPFAGDVQIPPKVRWAGPRPEVDPGQKGKLPRLIQGIRREMGGAMMGAGVSLGTEDRGEKHQVRRERAFSLPRIMR